MPGADSLVHSFLAGAVSFLSHCILPLIPGYLALACTISFHQGSGRKPGYPELRPALLSYLFFILGFAVMFSFMSAFVVGLGSPLSSSLLIMRRITGFMTIAVGLQTMGAHWLRTFLCSRSSSRYFYPIFIASFLIGAALPSCWIPCVGPSLGSALELASDPSTQWRGIALLFTYCLGMGLPFIGIGLLVNSLWRVASPRPWVIRCGELCCGLVLITIGVLMVCGRWNLLMALMPSWIFARPGDLL